MLADERSATSGRAGNFSSGHRCGDGWGLGSHARGPSTTTNRSLLCPWMHRQLVEIAAFASDSALLGFPLYHRPSAFLVYSFQRRCQHKPTDVRAVVRESQGPCGRSREFWGVHPKGARSAGALISKTQDSPKLLSFAADHWREPTHSWPWPSPFGEAGGPSWEIQCPVRCLVKRLQRLQGPRTSRAQGRLLDTGLGSSGEQPCTSKPGQ